MRGTVVGLVVAAGGAWGHQWAGGATAPLPVALLLVASVLLGGGMTRRDRPLSPLGLVATALGVQVAWHLVLTATAPPVQTHHAMTTDPAAMVGVHLAVAAATVALAAGADRALVGLCREALARLLPPAVTRSPRPAPRQVVVPIRTLRGRVVARATSRGPPLTRLPVLAPAATVLR